MTDVSPILPATLPQTKGQEKTRSLNKGVAPVTTSKGRVNLTSCEVKASSKIALAPKAGLKILWPKPPKGSLTKAMARIEPITGIHQAVPGGKIKPSSRPVTAALPSPNTPLGVKGTLSITASVNTAAAVLKSMISPARQRKKTRPATTAGKREIRTSTIIRSIVNGLRRNGPVLICIFFTPSSLFPSPRLNPLCPS